MPGILQGLRSLGLLLVELEGAELVEGQSVQVLQDLLGKDKDEEREGAYSISCDWAGTPESATD